LVGGLGLNFLGKFGWETRESKGERIRGELELNKGEILEKKTREVLTKQG